MTGSLGARPLRVGIAGQGWFGRIHLDAWQEIAGVEVVAVCDSDPAALRGDTTGRAPQDAFHQDATDSAGASLSPAIRQFASVAALLREADVEVLDVVVPEQAHAEVATLALDAGVAVIVEKPFVLGLDDALRLQAQATRCRLPIYVGHVLRFDLRYRTVQERISTTNEAVRHLSLQRHFQTSAHDVYGRTDPYFAALIHDIDLAVWLSGSRVTQVHGITRSFLGRGTPDVATGTLWLDNGAVAIVQNTWHLPVTCPYGFTFETTVYTERTTYGIRNEPEVHVWGAGGVVSPELHFWPRIGGARRGALVDELTHFAACARRGVDSPVIPVADAVHVVAVAEALQRSALEGRNVSIER